MKLYSYIQYAPYVNIRIMLPLHCPQLDKTRFLSIELMGCIHLHLPGCIIYSTTSGDQGISTPPSEERKYHIRHSAVKIKLKQRLLFFSIHNVWKLKVPLLFCCYILITDTFRYPLLAFLFAVFVYILRTKVHKAGDQTREGCFIGN